MRYYVQFNAGLAELAVSALTQDLGQAAAVFRDDSAAVVETTAEPAQVAALAYLKNSFLVLAEARRGRLAVSVPALATQLSRAAASRLIPARRPFRVLTSVDGGLVAVPPAARARLESVVAERTGGFVQARGGGEEYWVIGRRDLPTLLLGLRLPGARPAAAPPGALRADLADLLVRASGPRPDDVFLDPFAGSGSLVLARLQFPARRVIYCDAGQREPRPELHRARKVQFLAEDALVLPSIADGAVDAVVTDPPWGEFQALDVPFPEFAAGLAASLRRVLRRPGGRFVVLISRRQEDALRQALAGAGLVPSAARQILVGGHPATVLAGQTGRPCNG